uniref:RNA/RNP complex-1-interacting phosphatase-like isoform X1 n=1 Tax=Pristiophorus japonicus TaxID=55135 RepID=UPI00398EB0BB
MVKKKRAIPVVWKGVVPVGRRIPRTRFIAFKVPLKGAVSQRLTIGQKFTPKDLIAQIKEQNEELGLIIDLTYTTRYYSQKDLPRNVQYQKLYTIGLEVPDEATILQFKRLTRKFLWENAVNDKIIGVHCTSGVNRTGYLVCRYLIDVEGMEPEAAIDLFNSARGHKMNGIVYLRDLRTGPKRSNMGMDAFSTEPEPEPEPVNPHPRDFAGFGSRFELPYEYVPLPANNFDHSSYYAWNDRDRPPPPPPSLSHSVLSGECRRFPLFDDYSPMEYDGRSRSGHFSDHKAVGSSEESLHGEHSRYTPYSTRPPIPAPDHFRHDFERNTFLDSSRRGLEPQNFVKPFTRDYNHGQPTWYDSHLGETGSGSFDEFNPFTHSVDKNNYDFPFKVEMPTTTGWQKVHYYEWD